MGPTVPGDVVAGFDDLLDRFRELLDAARIDEESPWDLQAVQQPDQPPNADPTAIGRPGLGRVVDGVLLELGGLHRIIRRTFVRPGFEHHRDRNRDLLAVRPAHLTGSHFLPFSVQSIVRYSRTSR